MDPASYPHAQPRSPNPTATSVLTNDRPTVAGRSISTRSRRTNLRRLVDSAELTGSDPPRQPVRVRPDVRLASVVLLAAVTNSCASGSGNVAPLGITIDGDRDLTLNVTCASAAQADIIELAAEVRIDDISGKPIDGDCFSQVPLRLDQPLGTRAIVVEGKTWQRVHGDCPYGEFGPGDLELPRSCEFPP